MQKISAGILLAMVLSIGCKSKQQPAEEDAGFFPISQILKDQVANVEQGVYPITRHDKFDSVKTEDFVTREDFRQLAAPFLDLPDISSKELKPFYTESKFFDQDLQKVVITYTATKEDLPVRREELHINPEQTADTINKVERIFIDTWKSNKDSTVQQHLSWKMDQSFRITKSISKIDGSEHTLIRDVRWNEPVN